MCRDTSRYEVSEYYLQKVRPSSPLSSAALKMVQKCVLASYAMEAKSNHSKIRQNDATTNFPTTLRRTTFHAINGVLSRCNYNITTLTKQISYKIKQFDSMLQVM